MDIHEIKVDGFRIIGNLHTTARQLFICSEVLVQLSNRQLPKDFLTQLLIDWSKFQENNNEIYSACNGKLTEKGKTTTALRHYLELCHTLGLITQLNSFYANTRISFVLLYFLQKEINRIKLSLPEAIFYLSQLLRKYADGIILVLELLSENHVNQKDLQRMFKDVLNKRLLSKQEFASQIIKSSISEKYRTLNYQWQKSESYSEHLLIPRCEWLNSLGIVNMQKKGSSTLYSLTEKGRLFYHELPTLPDRVTKDINDEWLSQRMFETFNSLYLDNRSYFLHLPKSVRDFKLGEALKAASEAVKSSSSFRLPLYDTILFVCLNLFINEQCIINYNDILNELKSSFVFEGKKYLAQEAGRINEGYITTIIA